MINFDNTLLINKIYDHIFSRFKKMEIESIILMGSAARNEISFSFENKNQIIVSDLEICVCFKSFLKSIHRRKIYYLDFENIQIEIWFTHKYFLKFIKTPLVYDLKKTGKVIWGKDIRESIWIDKPEQIPYWEGIRLLYNRLIDYLVLLWKLRNENPIQRSDEYYHVKMLIGIGEYIMIKTGHFTSSYRDKLKHIELRFTKNKMTELIIEALKYKLNIIDEFNNFQNVELTSVIIYKILKKINPYINNFKIPISLKIYQIIQKVLKKDFSALFTKFEMIKIYKNAFKLLEYYINFPSKFLKCGKYIEKLRYDWENCSPDIQSSFF